MWLVITNTGNPAAFAVPLPFGDFLIGRGESCDLSLLERHVSDRHVLLTRSDDRISFRDLRSSSGVLHNGKVSTEGELTIGDLLTVGHYVIQMSAKPQLQPNSAHPSAKSSQPAAPMAPRLGKLLQKLLETREPTKLLAVLLDGLLEIIKADRGFVLLADDDDKGLKPVASRSISNSDFFNISSTIYNKVLSTKSTMLISNSLEDEHCKHAPSLAPGFPRTIICSPLSDENRTFGVIYVDRPLRQIEITCEQIELFEAVCSLAVGVLSASETRRTLYSTQQKLLALSSLPGRETSLVGGNGPSHARLEQLIQLAAGQDITVLITGETGTGKEMVGKSLHTRSKRCNGPFIAVNCAALPKDIIEVELFGCEKGAFTGADRPRVGRFELASSGTLFLDEVGELSTDLQVKLLRVLQERSLTRLGGSRSIPLDFRLVCATNADLKEALRTGAMREDFYYRINVFNIELMPLRERPEDIPVLARYFVKRSAKRFNRSINGLSDEAITLLTSYRWPGNVRELKNVIERAVIIERNSFITPASISLGTPPDISTSPDDAGLRFVQSLPVDYERASQSFERIFLRNALERCKGNVTALAKQLGMGRNTLYRKFARLGIERNND